LQIRGFIVNFVGGAELLSENTKEKGVFLKIYISVYIYFGDRTKKRVKDGGDEAEVSQGSVR